MEKKIFLLIILIHLEYKKWIRFDCKLSKNRLQTRNIFVIRIILLLFAIYQERREKTALTWYLAVALPMIGQIHNSYKSFCSLKIVENCILQSYYTFSFRYLFPLLLSS